MTGSQPEAQHQNWHNTTSPNKKLDTLLSSQKTPAHQHPTVRRSAGAAVLVVSATVHRADPVDQRGSRWPASGLVTDPEGLVLSGVTLALPRLRARVGARKPIPVEWATSGPSHHLQEPDLRKILSPSHTSGSYLRSTTRSLSGMSALSVILMCSGQTSVQHLVMLQ